MGLKLLLEQEGVGVEISREKYESGDWADLVAEADAEGERTSYVPPGAATTTGRAEVRV